jgi:hypothetical protein
MSVSLRALIIALLVAAVAWTTREVTGFGYLPLVDDDVNIFYNPHMGAPDAARLHWMATDFSYVHRYMPLGWLGFSLAYSVSGLDPWAYHAAGVLLHAVNAALVFLLLGQLLLRFEGGAAEGDRLVCAGLGALLWALHPLRVETTSWCSGLLYAQAAFLALLCACAHMAELRALAEGRRVRGALLFGAVCLAYLASMLTYPVALFLPFALVVLDQAWLSGPAGGAARRTARLRSAFLCLASLAGLFLTVHARGTAVVSWLRAPTVAEFGLVDRLLQASYVAVVYVWRTLWTGDVRWMPLTLFDAGAIGMMGWASAAFILALSVAAWRARRRAPYLIVCWVCFLVLVTPNLGLSEHPHTIADRYLYFTGIVFSAALAMALARIRSRGALAISACACAAAAAACAWVSLVQARTWRNTETFEARMMRNPDADLDHITAARAGKLRFLQGDVRGGREAVRAELARAPAVGGVILTWRQMAPAGPLEPEVAARRLQEWPAAPLAYADLQIATAQVAEGRMRDALRHMDAAIAMTPGFTEARFRRGVLLASSGNPAAALHDWLYVEREAEMRPGLNHAQFDYITEDLKRAFEAQNDGRASGLLQAAKARVDALSVPLSKT